MREVLGIAKKEFHDSIVDLVKRKRLSTETEPEKPVEVRTTHIEDMVLEDELAESHYLRLHWAQSYRRAASYESKGLRRIPVYEIRPA